MILKLNLMPGTMNQHEKHKIMYDLGEKFWMSHGVGGVAMAETAGV